MLWTEVVEPVTCFDGIVLLYYVPRILWGFSVKNVCYFVVGNCNVVINQKKKCKPDVSRLWGTQWARILLPTLLTSSEVHCCQYAKARDLSVTCSNMPKDSKWCLLWREPTCERSPPHNWRGCGKDSKQTGVGPSSHHRGGLAGNPT